MRVSVVATVLNEGPAIGRLMESLAKQSRRPDEVVIVDGGSTDGTVAVLQDWAAEGRLQLQIVEAPGANISQGRNVAIAAATGEVIASTDAGVRLEQEWLEALVAPFEEADNDPSVAVVAGWFVAEPQGPFEVAMGATVLPSEQEINPGAFLPSSRSVAFLKSAWEAVGGYPEWLDFCEDLIFDLRLKDLYGRFPFVPEAKVHFRPRGNLRAFFKQYYQYARGDGKADLWRKRHLVRYLTYLFIGPGLVALALLHSAWWWMALLAGVAIYTAAPYRRLRPMLKGHNLFAKLKMVLLVPVIRVVGDVAKMLGYPVGLVWRLRNWDRSEVHWRETV